MQIANINFVEMCASFFFVAVSKASYRLNQYSNASLTHVGLILQQFVLITMFSDLVKWSTI